MRTLGLPAPQGLRPSRKASNDADVALFATYQAERN
jgi:hypothetical protein